MGKVLRKYLKPAKYKVILADPPWRYKDKCHAGKRGVAYKYPTLSIQDIRNLRVRELADDNCILFLWATFPLLKEAISVIEGWGFAYKTGGFTWVKTNVQQKDTLFWGMGNWTRSNPEPCLMGIKGKPKRFDAGVHSVIMSPWLPDHKKPPESRDRIERLCGDVPRLELFANEKVKGWDAFGYGVDQQDIRESISTHLDTHRQKSEFKILTMSRNERGEFDGWVNVSAESLELKGNNV